MEIATAVSGTVHAWNKPDPDAYPLPPGVWDAEPRKVQWVDSATGLPCLILRNHLGALCGYAGVYPGHPWKGLDYDDYKVSVDVHGGLTFSDSCAHSKDEAFGICHVPEPGTSDDVWWFGFDCLHCFDHIPGTDREREGSVYRDAQYVAAQVTQLAAQLAARQKAA
jgi:hypothetical protein